VLTDQERSLVRRMFAQGPSVLLEEGYTADTVKGFMARDDVKAELEVLQIEFNNQEALFGRSKFASKRQLTKLSPGAVAILGQALAGPTYARSNDGAVLNDAKGNPILMQPEPTAIQLRAAETILDRIGVEGDMKVDRAQDVNLRILFHPDTTKKVKIEQDEALSEEERALARERIRNAIEKIIPKLGHAKQQADAKLKLAKKPTKKPTPAATD
jgi:hypothetical protein